jgi:octaheme c-type cytochrome (tetrathionate reductase family)
MKTEAPCRVRIPFFTNGTLILLGFIAVGYTFGLTRMVGGLGTVTNLDDQNPWGIWIAFDVACGVALAAGGFTTAALVEIFGRGKYRPLLRPALLTALLGYLWVVVALIFDLGRYWNIWRPLFNWQGNSVLFEVGMCVMFYLTVLFIEMSPAILEGLEARMGETGAVAGVLRRLERPVRMAHAAVNAVLPLFIVAGVVLSFMHQSSLGTLMMIAPTKLSPLWFSPILPLLFLLSAIMVGYPMVVLESMIAAVSFGRDPEMKLLGPLSEKARWLMAAYLAVKIGDLVVRHDQLDFVSDPGQTVALTVELSVGVVAPLALLSIAAVRRSAGWLFFSSMLVIFGVIMNRINVFLVAYQPPFLRKGYFPSVGEIAMTIAIVCSIMFVYRFFVIYFPVLSGYCDDAAKMERRETPVKPHVSWIFRGAAAALLLTFVVVYTLVHRGAIRESRRTYRPVPATTIAAVERPDDAFFRHAGRPNDYRNMYELQHPFLNAGTNDYEPVRFSHRSHDVSTGGDCSACHHRIAMGDDDRTGVELKSLHAEIGVRIGGPCSSCHEDLAEKTLNRCDQCHRYANEADNPSRIGLKGALHRQCIGCHERHPEMAPPPTDCLSCHHPNVPDHGALVAVGPLDDSPRAITGECLRCHAAAGKDILRSAHWSWSGATPTVAGLEHRTDVGLRRTLDNYAPSLVPTTAGNAVFHIGYGWREDGFDLADAHGIDCLVCHDAGSGYARGAAGLPAAGVDLAAAARRVGRPSRANCGSCHFFMAGGPNVKHGDMEPSLAVPGNSLDVHMGKVDMRCQDCHTTAAHRIAGLSFNKPTTEGRVACARCHGDQPHGISGVFSRHLDDHVDTVACETCHIPDFARETPTRLSSDFATAGRQRAPAADALGMPVYDIRFGALAWGRHVVPVYRWFDGSRAITQLGDTIDPSGPVPLNAPLGEKHHPEARIFPFKVHTATQPYDLESRILLPVRLEDGLWLDYDWNRAIAAAAAAHAVPYSGRHGFARTEMFTSIHHGVVPPKQALGCSDCHALRAVTCSRCHPKAAGMRNPDHTRMVYPAVKGRLDFAELGYQDDPALIGGRFFTRLGRGRPPE